MTDLPLATRLTALANPKRFLDISGAVLPWVAGAAVLTLAVGFYLSLFATPPDYQQGQTVKIMFVHVPAAWLGMFAYAVMAGASFTGLVFKHPLADMSAKAAAPLGAAFTALALLTGSLWGKPMWGTYWVWDARLTSELILLFIYLGYIALWDSIEDPVRAAKATAVLALVGAVNLPIIHFSVDWWNTLHQPASLIREGGPAIHPAFLWPLLIMAIGYNLLFVWLWLLRIRTEIFRRRARSLMLAQGAGM
jgi:heme exporter protein C